MVLMVSLSRYILINYSQVDPKGVIIIGKQLGGYISTLAMAKDSAGLVFKCGVAISPIVEWIQHGKRSR